MSARRSAGFTLIEVMVAVAILALSLSAIFSSEAGAAKVAHRSRKMGLAALAVRCKMNEIEEQIAEEGLPALFDSDSDACCEEAPTEGVTCDWEIEPITLPDTMFAPEDSAETAQGADGTARDGKATDPGSSAQAPGAKPGALDPLLAVRDLDPEQALAGGGLGGMAAMALGFAYPVLKPGFEAQIRRATVTVHWKEGSKEHSFDVTQYVVADPPAAPGAAGQQAPEGQAAPGAPGSSQEPPRSGRSPASTLRSRSNL